MTDTLLKSRKKIPEPFTEILRAVFGAANEFEINAFVVGATARDLIFEYVYEANIRRKTEDIDFGIAVENWAQYESLKNYLIATGKFKDDAKNKQRIQWKSGGAEMKVDLVPFGGIENPVGEIAFPPDGDFVMSTIGFSEACADSVFLEIDEKLTIRVASLAGIVLLKFVAYNDRPMQRRRDVQDIFFIAKNYLNAGNDDRLYDADADLLDDDFNYETAGARLLGRDLKSILTEATKEIIAKLLAEESGGGSLEKLADINARDELNDEDRYKVILDTFRQLRTGIFE